MRLLKNKFYEDLKDLYKTSPTQSELKNILGRARAKRGMFEGDLEEGELEIGQISSLIDKIDSVSDIVDSIITEFNACQTRISTINLNK